VPKPSWPALLLLVKTYTAFAYFPIRKKCAHRTSFEQFILLVVLHCNFSKSTCICRLDVGDGKDVDLPECPRTLLKKQCIKYLGPVRNVQAIFI